MAEFNAQDAYAKLVEDAFHFGFPPTAQALVLIEIDGIDAHDEDRWVGQTTNVGDATIRWRGHVGRCLTTSRDPDSGDIDLPTLDMLRNYRAELESTEPLPFGIYGEVLEGGAVRVGDEVILDGRG